MTLSARIGPETLERLKRTAEKSRRTVSAIAAELLEKYA